jgi:hypothetical protein
MSDLDARIDAAQIRLARLLRQRIADALRSVPAFAHAVSVTVAVMDHPSLVRVTGPRGTSLLNYDKPRTPKLTALMDDPWSVEQDVALLMALPAARRRLPRTKRDRDYVIRLPKRNADA